MLKSKHKQPILLGDYEPREFACTPEVLILTGLKNDI